MITGRDRDRLWEDTDQRAGVARLAGHDLVQPVGSCWVSLSYEGEFNLQPDRNRTGPHGVQLAATQHARSTRRLTIPTTPLPNRARATAIEVTFRKPRARSLPSQERPSAPFGRCLYDAIMVAPGVQTVELPQQPPVGERP